MHATEPVQLFQDLSIYTVIWTSGQGMLQMLHSFSRLSLTIFSMPSSGFSCCTADCINFCTVSATNPKCYWGDCYVTSAANATMLLPTIAADVGQHGSMLQY